MAEKIIPKSVEMFNAGKCGSDFYFFEERTYYKNIFTSAFSKSISDDYVDNIKIERAHSKYYPNFHLICLALPHNNEIGDAVLVGVVIDTSLNKAVAYCMEKSVKEYMIGQWSTDFVHSNYGRAINKTYFFLRIMMLASEDFKDFVNFKEVHPKYDNINKTYGESPKGEPQHEGRLRKYRELLPSKKFFLILLAVVGLFILSAYIGKKNYPNPVPIDEIKSDDIITEEVFDSDQPSSESEFDDHHITWDITDPEYQELLGKDELLGETFTYNPEDHTIRTSQGKIISEEKTVTSSRLPTKKSTRVQDAVERKYDNVKFENFLNGEIPYLNVYGKGSFDPQSLSSLKVINYSSTDAVVLLCNTNGNVVRNIFIRQNSTIDINEIPSGKYIMKVMYGNDWYSHKDNGQGNPEGGFTKNVSYSISKWADAFDFIPRIAEDGIDYPLYEITLHKVANGNFKTKHSNINEFFNN